MKTPACTALSSKHLVFKFLIHDDIIMDINQDSPPRWGPEEPPSPGSAPLPLPLWHTQREVRERKRAKTGDWQWKLPWGKYKALLNLHFFAFLKWFIRVAGDLMSPSSVCSTVLQLMSTCQSLHDTPHFWSSNSSLFSTSFWTSF